MIRKGGQDETHNNNWKCIQQNNAVDSLTNEAEDAFVFLQKHLNCPSPKVLRVYNYKVRHY